MHFVRCLWCKRRSTLYNLVGANVDDLDAAVKYLSARGVRMMAGPIVVHEGRMAGMRARYFLDPWGNQLELVEYKG